MSPRLLLLLLPLLLLSSSGRAEDRLGETKEQLIARWGKATAFDQVFPPATEACRFNPDGDFMWVDVQFWEGKSSKFVVLYNNPRNQLQESDVPQLLKQLSDGGPWQPSGDTTGDVLYFVREDGSAQAKFYLKSEPRQLVIESTAFIKAKEAGKDKARGDAIRRL